MIILGRQYTRVAASLDYHIVEHELLGLANVIYPQRAEACFGLIQSEVVGEAYGGNEPVEDQTGS